MMARDVAPPSSLPTWVPLAIVPGLFLIGARLSLYLTVAPQMNAVLWMPNALLLGVLFHSGWRHYGWFGAAVLSAQIVAGLPSVPIVQSLLFGAINLLEVTIAFAILKRVNFDPRFGAPRDVGAFVLAGPGVGAFVSSGLATGVCSYFRGLDASFGEFWRVWWLSDGLGLFIVTPLVLIMWPPIRDERHPRAEWRWYDSVALLLSALALAAFASAQDRVFHGVTLRPFVIIPGVVYVAARFSPRTASAVLILVTAVILAIATSGRRPFGDIPPRETIIAVHQLIFVMGTLSLGLSVLRSQHQTHTRDLERRVAERTEELSRANAALERLASVDPLTELLNRRVLFALTQREIERAARHGSELAVIVVDLDHFKNVNDAHGHEAGDAVLKATAKVAHSMLRTTDAIARYGGEEFVIVAPGTDSTTGLQLA